MTESAFQVREEADDRRASASDGDGTSAGIGDSDRGANWVFFTPPELATITANGGFSRPAAHKTIVEEATSTSYSTSSRLSIRPRPSMSQRASNYVGPRSLLLAQGTYRAMSSALMAMQEG